MVDYIEILRDIVPVSEDNGFISGDQEKIFFFINNSIPFNPLSLRFTMFVTEDSVYLIGSKQEISLIKDYINYPVKFVTMDMGSYMENYEIPVKEIKTIIEDNNIYSISYTTSSWSYFINELVDESDYVENIVSSIADIKDKDDIDKISYIQGELINLCDSIIEKYGYDGFRMLEEKIKNANFVDSFLSPIGFYCDKETFLNDITFEKKEFNNIIRIECNVRNGIIGVHLSRNYTKNKKIKKNIENVRKQLSEIVKLIKPGMITKNAFDIVRKEIKKSLKKDIMTIPGLPLGYVMPGSIYISPYSDEIIKEGMVFFFQIFIGMRDYGIKEGYMIEITSKGGRVL